MSFHRRASSKVNLAIGQRAHRRMILMLDTVIDFVHRNKYRNEREREKEREKEEERKDGLLPNFPPRTDRKDKLFISG